MGVETHSASVALLEMPASSQAAKRLEASKARTSKKQLEFADVTTDGAAQLSRVS